MKINPRNFVNTVHKTTLRFFHCTLQTFECTSQCVASRGQGRWEEVQYFGCKLSVPPPPPSPLFFWLLCNRQIAFSGEVDFFFNKGERANFALLMVIVVRRNPFFSHPCKCLRNHLLSFPFLMSSTTQPPGLP